MTTQADFECPGCGKSYQDYEDMNKCAAGHLDVPWGGPTELDFDALPDEKLVDQAATTAISIEALRSALDELHQEIMFRSKDREAITLRSGSNVAVIKNGDSTYDDPEAKASAGNDRRQRPRQSVHRPV